MASSETTLGTTSHSTAYFIFHSDGSISYPFSQFNAGNSTTPVKLISGGLLWPSAAELASGRIYHGALRIQYSVAGKQAKITSHVTVRSGGTATVTVPAGTNSATIVAMTMTETVEGFAVSIEVKTWLASSVGPVQSEAITTEAGTSHVVSKEQLISFTKG